MYNSMGQYYLPLREFLNTVPVIETHEHYTGIVKPVENILAFISGDYYSSDFIATSNQAEEAYKIISDTSISFDERYAVFEKYYEKSCMTAYARGMRSGLKECWGVESIDKASIQALEEKFKHRNQDFYFRVMNKLGIKAKIVDTMESDIESFVNGENNDYTNLCRFAFPLPQYHDMTHVNTIPRLEKYIGRRITSLDDYLEGFEKYFKKCVDFGIKCIKDQTAYRRSIYYTYPSRSEAEKVFNKIMIKPRDAIGSDELNVLDDWLFHYFMKIAQKYNLPVQLHTGHMAGIRNDIVKANAANLIPVLELHKDVVFDLFHGNWPYMGELLFLGKNYPNVWIDLCWLHCLDPLYAIELMKRLILTVPHAKVMAFGGDTSEPEWTAGYLDMARNNMAFALSDLIDHQWIDLDEAKSIAVDWLFNNPNEFFKLGFSRIND